MCSDDLGNVRTSPNSLLSNADGRLIGWWLIGRHSENHKFTIFAFRLVMPDLLYRICNMLVFVFSFVFVVVFFLSNIICMN